MPADFFVDAGRRVVFSRFAGVLTRAVAWDHMGRLRRHRDFRPEFDQLADFRPVTAIEMSHEDIREFAHASLFSPGSKRAFLVGSDWQYGMARVFGTYRELEGEAGIAVVRTMEEALRWLGLRGEPAFTAPDSPADG
jgi:hypothetical protein